MGILQDIGRAGAVVGACLVGGYMIYGAILAIVNLLRRG